MLPLLLSKWGNTLVMIRRQMFTESDHAHGTEKLYKAHMSSSMKKTVQRQRKRDNLAANPDLALACDRSLLLLQIPPTLLFAWKVFDSGQAAVTRVIIPTTEPNLDSSASPWDGVEMGHLKQHQSSLPNSTPSMEWRVDIRYLVFMHYSLINARNRMSNSSWLDVAGRQWSFKSFLSDYEQGAYNSVLDVFPGIGEEGCFFHLCKRLDFQVKRSGFMTKYLTDDDFKLRVKMLSAPNLKIIRQSGFWKTIQSTIRHFHEIFVKTNE